MFRNYYIPLLILLLIISCKDSKPKENKGVQKKLVIPKKKSVNLEDSLFVNVIQKYYKNSKFDKTVVDKDDSNISILSQMFSINGLIKIITYKRKDYKKLNYYTIHNNFWLIVLEYETPLVANRVFTNVRKIYLNSENDNFLNDLKQITPHLSNEHQKGYIDPSMYLKSGGFYTTKGNKIYYLVESCGNSRKYWKNYNTLFLEYLFDKKKDYKVLNFNCGEEFPNF